MKEEKLIFIVSQPRSGSTLLQAVLSNHPKVDTISEPWILLPFLSLYKPSLVEAKYNYQLSVKALSEFQEKSQSKMIFRENYKQFLLNVYNKIEKERGNYIIDKTPRYYEIFDIVYDFFPLAKFIILKRHPVAVLNSIISTWNRFTFKELSSEHQRDIFEAPFLLKKWENEYRQQHNVKVVKYEDVLNNPGNQVRSIFQWLGITYSEDLLDYSQNNSFKGKYGDPTGIHRFSSPSDRHANNWKSQLKNKVLGSYLNGYGHFLGKDFLCEYGYSDDQVYHDSFKFRLFKYYCVRSKYLKKRSIKDSIVSLIIRNYLGEDI